MRKYEGETKKILKYFGFLVEKYISLNKCAKSVREALKKAKTEHYHGKVILRRHSGDEEIVKEF